MEITKSLQTVNRCAGYLRYLRDAMNAGEDEISLSDMSAAMDIDVKGLVDDIAAITGGNVANYAPSLLISAIEHYLGYDDTCSAVLVGVGNLGSAILSYKGFSDYGIDIVAAFDHDPSVVGTEVCGKSIMDAKELYSLCGRLRVLIGIITVPASQAQSVCDIMVASGIHAIWNFARCDLKVPSDVLVQNENIADALLNLSGRIEQEIKTNPDLTDSISEFDTVNAIMNKYNRDPAKRAVVLDEAASCGISSYGIDFINEVLA